MNALIVVNTANFMLPVCRDSFIAAADRWRCDYIEVKASEYEHSPSCIKFDVATRVQGYDTILILDADMLVMSDAPNPFPMCESESVLYLCSDVQEPFGQSARWKKEVYDDALEYAQSWTELKWKGSPSTFFNSGFCMFKNTFWFSHVFATVRGYMPRPCQLLPEQAIFNLVIEHMNVPVKFVDNRWNRVVHPEGPDQNAYINHFAGEAKHMIAGSNWKKEQP